MSIVKKTWFVESVSKLNKALSEPKKMNNNRAITPFRQRMGSERESCDRIVIVAQPLKNLFSPDR